MFVLFYLVIISFTYLMVHSEGETKCECSDRTVIKEMVQEILAENKLELTRLRRREARQRKAVHSSLSPVFNVRLEELEQKVMVLEMKLNDTITKSKEEQARFDRNIGTVVEDILEREKKNIIVEIDTKLDGMQQVYKSCQSLATDLFNVGKSVNEARHRITLLDKLDVEKKDRLEKLEQSVEKLEMKDEETVAKSSLQNNINEMKESIETFKIAMNNTIQERFTHVNVTRESFVSKMKRKIMEHKEVIDTFKSTINKSIEELFIHINSSQTEQSRYLKGSLAVIENITANSISIVLSNMSTMQEDVIVEVNRRLDGIQRVNKSCQSLATELTSVDKIVNEARHRITLLDKLDEEKKDRLEKLEKNVENLEMKVDEKVMTADMNKNIIGLNESIETFKVAMNNTIEERFTHINETMARFASKKDRQIMDHMESIDTFKLIMNITIGEHFKYINASQTEQSKEMKENLANFENSTVESIRIIFGNLTTFKGDIMEVNRRLDGIEQVNKSIQILSTHLFTLKQSMNGATQMIGLLEKIITEDKDHLEKLEQNVENLETKVEEKVVTAVMNNIIIGLNESIETFKVATNNTIDEHFTHINETRTTFVSEMNKKFMDHMEIIDTFKLTTNITIDKYFKQINAIQNEQSKEMKGNLAIIENMTAESNRIVFGNFSTFTEDIIEVNRRLNEIEQVNKSTQILSTDVNTVKQSINEARQMIESVEKIITENKDGIWSSWSSWGSCSASCLGGIAKRTRQCNNMTPSSYGHGCIGNNEETKACNSASCPAVHGQWASWSKWGSCSVQCGEGTKKRTRSCNNPAPSGFGRTCTGNSEERDFCNENGCQVRLVGGSKPYDGRLEVFHNGAWGTVCDDYFEDASASVVCKMLNFPNVMPKVYPSAHFGEGTLPIILDDVQCQGKEGTLFNCPHKPWTEHNCQHSEDVGISCVQNLSVRLVGGSTSRRGRVEVSLDGSTWGTVCDDYFSNNSAKVVCRMLGYPTTNAQADTSVSEGSGDVFLDDVVCDGTEATLFFCTHSKWGVENCSHSEDVGVICA